MAVSVIDLQLERFAYGGDAIGRDETGRAVFVPFAQPGERVRARIVEEKRGFARAELLEVLTASPERIEPKCRHFPTPSPVPGPTADAAILGDGLVGASGCGGCHYQHLTYEAQLRAKREILRDQLQRIGRIEDPPVREAVPSPAEWNYRNHIQFHLTADGKLGFVAHSALAPATPGAERLLPITECHLPEAPINALWPQLEFEPGSPISRAGIRLGDEEDLMLVLESDSPQPPDLEIEAGISAVHLFEEDTLILAGDDHVTIRVLERAFRVSAGSFFQVNTAMAGKMVEHLLSHLPVSPATHLLDVYCGVGLFSAFFAPRVATVTGIESAPSACGDFAANLDEFENVALYEAAAEDALPYLDLRPEVILLDPPRAGLDRRVLDAVLALRPASIAYVSCDPSTLARDAARLISGGYRLTDVTPFDLFPQTYHIESISTFEK
jgi:23S rRNA (uracil1939-C5)-methyltransferase